MMHVARPNAHLLDVVPYPHFLQVLWRRYVQASSSLCSRPQRFVAFLLRFAHGSTVAQSSAPDDNRTNANLSQYVICVGAVDDKCFSCCPSLHVLPQQSAPLAPRAMSRRPAGPKTQTAVLTTAAVVSNYRLCLKMIHQSSLFRVRV